MNENSDLLPNLLHEDFEMQMRGYSRRQVDDFVARRTAEIRDLEQRLARALDETDHLRREVATARQQALAGRPAHEEVSERIAQILKLADDEANAQRGKADDEIARLRAEAQQESERVRADSRDQAERMLTAAQEQAERTISAARGEADKTRTAARTEADRLTSETRNKADAALATAKAQAKKVLDEATARATAIHDGAERRLNLLSTRHTETVRRLADILDGVQDLVAAENARMTLEEEVSAQAAKTMAMANAAGLEQAATAGDVFAPAGEADLALLAPPAPETVASGVPALADPAGGRRGAPLAEAPALGSPAHAAPPRGAESRGTASRSAESRGAEPNGAPAHAAPLPAAPAPAGPLGGPAPGGSGSRPDGRGSGGQHRAGNAMAGHGLPPSAASPSLPVFPPPGPGPRSPIAMPGGTVLPSRAAGREQDDDLGRDRDFGRGRDFDRDRDFDPLRDPIQTTGTIDPDEPTEGIRLMP
jgi:cell division septum initiation protein DivIVA